MSKLETDLGDPFSVLEGLGEATSEIGGDFWPSKEKALSVFNKPVTHDSGLGDRNNRNIHYKICFGADGSRIGSPLLRSCRHNGPTAGSDFF